MKKYNPASLYIVMLCISLAVSFYIPKPESADAAEETVIIPDEAIRLRILANSDSEKDQTVKKAIRDEVNANITEWVKDLTSLDTARDVINSHLPDIQTIAERYVAEHGLDQEVAVSFGPAQFPTKLYGQYLYPAGEYEAIVITLGEGKGANWWCVLFPPLCFLDFSNGTAVSQSPMADDEDEMNEEEPEQTESVNKKEKQAQKEDEEEEEEEEQEKETEQEEQVAAAPVYADESQADVVEKKLFLVEMFNSLF